MSDNQRRAVCRLAFLIFCALPTIVVGYYIFHPQTPVEWQQRIQAQLAVRTTIDSIETPGPYETVLRGLKFIDEDDQELLAATEVRILMGDTNRIEILHPVRLTSHGLQHLIENAHKQLVRSHSIDKSWALYIAKATVQSSSVSDDHFGTEVPREFSLEHTTINIATDPEATIAQMEFTVGGNVEPKSNQQVERVICALHRPRNMNARTLAKLDTRSMLLPCWLADGWLPQLRKHFGKEVQFQGQLGIDPEDAMRATHIAGKLQQVDLALYPDSSNDRFGARWASIEIQHCGFSAGDVDSVAWLKIQNRPRTRMEKPIKVFETVDLNGSMRNAINDSRRQSISRLP